MRGSEEVQSILTAAGRFSAKPDYVPPTAFSHQPFCGDSEGWGPVSSLRWDLTPCFLDIWIAGVAAWGVFFGAGALWYLFRKGVAQDVPKNWHFYAKL